MTEGARSILVVDDDATFRERLVRAFATRGFEARGAAHVDDAVAAATAESPELAVVDLRMPGRSGLELVRELLAVDATTKIVVLTGYGSIATALEAVRLGAVRYLTRPADVDEILSAFERSRDTDKPLAIEHEVASLARTEWEHIHRVLTDCNGNVSQARARSASTGGACNGSSRSTRRHGDWRPPAHSDCRSSTVNWSSGSSRAS